MEIQTVRRQAQSRLLCRFFSTSFIERRIWSAGWQEEEEELVMSMPEKPNSVRTHGDLRRGNLAFKLFTELEPMSSDRYKVAGSMFADAAENESATEIWKHIGENELEITHGMRFIKIDGVVHEVVVWTIHHSRHKEIYMWSRVHRLLVIVKLKLELHSLLWKIAKPLKMAVLSWACYTLDTQRGF